MANYGTNPPWTGWSGILANFPPTNAPSPPNVQGTSGVVRFNGLTQDDNRIANILNRKANQAVRMLFISMIGAAPGATASKSFKRVKAKTMIPDPTTGVMSNIGGLVEIESVFYINRANTVTDDNNLTALLNRTHAPVAYAVDISGNGGGRKALDPVYR